MNAESVPFLVRMPPELHAAVKEAALAADLTMAQFVRAALRAALEAAGGAS